MLQEQVVYAARAFRAERKVRSTFVLTKGESDEEKEIEVGAVHFLPRCVVAWDKEDDGMALVQSIEGVSPLDTVSDGLGCNCLKWAAAENVKNMTGVDRLKRKNYHTVAR